MKKLALSVVFLMVAGAGVSVGAVGCSSSSGTGATSDDSGTTSDVTTGDDSGSAGETSVDDSSASDSGTASETSTACVTDAAVIIGSDTDAGFVPNDTCNTCIASMCATAACPCLTDTNLDDAGGNQCGDYVGCVYNALATALAADPDAGLAGLATVLPNAESTCATGLPASSSAAGKTLATCVAGNCASQCL